MIESGSVIVNLVTDTAGSRIGTCRIKELVLDVLIAVDTLRVNVCTCSVLGILVSYLSLRGLDSSITKLTGICSDTVGLTCCIRKSCYGIYGIFSLDEAVCKDLTVVIIGVTLVTLGIDNKLSIGYHTALATLRTRSKTALCTGSRSTGDLNLEAFMVKSRNWFTTGLNDRTTRALYALLGAGSGTGCGNLSSINKIMTESSTTAIVTVTGKSADATLGGCITGCLRPLVIGNLALYEITGLTGLSCAAKAACLSPVVTECSSPVIRGKSAE